MAVSDKTFRISFDSGARIFFVREFSTGAAPYLDASSVFDLKDFFLTEDTSLTSLDSIIETDASPIDIYP